MISPTKLVQVADLALATGLETELGKFDHLISMTDREDVGFAGEVEKLEVAAATLRLYFAGSEVVIDVNDLMLYAEHTEVETTWYDYIESTRDIM